MTIGADGPARDHASIRSRRRQYDCRHDQLTRAAVEISRFFPGNRPRIPMGTDKNPSVVLRYWGIGGGFLAPLFALLIVLTVLPISVEGAQDNQARQNRGALADQARQPVPLQRLGPLAAPSEGLTLDRAVERMERKNLDLAAMWLEVPQARADIVSAWQQPNSVFFIGSGREGLVRLRPLGAVPKRWARALAASLAAQVIEAQYHDAVRTHTADLYTAYVDVLEAQVQARLTRASLTSLEELAKVTNGPAESGQVARASIAATDAEVALRKARFTLADLLDIPDAEAERLEIEDENENRELPLPTLAELTQLALRHRPDLRAYRLGLWRAQAEWLRSWVEQWPDFYALAGPDRRGRPVAGKEAIALPWASGLLVSFPDSGQHRGKVARAQINFAQSRIELARVERQVVLDVRRAHLEYTHSLAVGQRLKADVLPSAERARDEALKQFRDGEVDKIAFLGAQSEYNVAVRDYLKAGFRRRRGALALNTAIGKRVLP
jgi:cobalt-zinc-cadmium efflux system outer membrane protein